MKDSNQWEVDIIHLVSIELNERYSDIGEIIDTNYSFEMSQHWAKGSKPEEVAKDLIKKMKT